MTTEVKPRQLTPRQAAFVAEYVKDGNATQAAIRAGYSEATAMQQGSRLLTHVEIRAALVEVHATAVERVERVLDEAAGSAAWIIEQAVRVVDEADNPRDRVPALALLAKRLPEWKDNVAVNVGVAVTVTRNTRSTR